MREIHFSAALAEAEIFEMERDPNIFIAGEDVSWGGSFGEYLKVKERFPERLFDTAITETAIAGLGLGSAIMGLRPILEFSFDDFMMVAADEIVNQIAKFSYMNGGKVKIPIVLSCNYGFGGGAAAQHSQSLEAMFAHIPGLKIVMPSNGADAKGLMTAAIRDDNPVMFFNCVRLIGTKGHVPEGEYIVPIGKADIKKEGNDVTIVSWGAMVLNALEAAEELEKEGISAEVVDLRSLVPLDKETVLESVKKTGRLVIAQTAVKKSGFGAEVAAVVAEEALDYLDAPIKRVGAPFCPVPFTPVLEKEYFVSPEKIVNAVKSLFDAVISA